MKPDLAKCLDDAADLLETAELAKEAFELSHFSIELGKRVPYAYCMLGAVRAACDKTLGRLGDETDSALEREVADLLGFKELDKVITWNDRKVRKKAEVVARLRLGAERAKLGAALSKTSGSSG